MPSGTVTPAGGGGGSIPSGNASPLGSVTPSGVGALYVDSSVGALWLAIGATSADWVQIGGATGFGSGSGQLVNQGERVILGDTPAVAGTGNRLLYAAGAADGQQFMDLQLGSAGQFDHYYAPDGTYSAGNGIKFPTADPHVAGAWWDNAGVLTKSAG